MSHVMSECFSIAFGVFPLSGRETIDLVIFDPFQTVFLPVLFYCPWYLGYHVGLFERFCSGGNISVWSIV